MENSVIGISIPQQPSRNQSADTSVTDTKPTQRIIWGFQKEMIEFLIRLEVLGLIMRYYPNPFTWIKVFRAMDPHRKNILGNRRVKKIAQVGNKYYWGAYIPAWPSRIFHDFLKAELHRVYPIAIKTNRLNNIYLAITNKCPLQCDHCYEWDALNKRENLSVEGLKSIVRKFQVEGVSQIHFSGGEPLVKMKDIAELLRTSEKKSEFWVLTSGYNLTLENAHVLKKAGLTGVMISLDHFDPEMHNMFRGFQNAYSGAIDGAKNAIDAGLVTVLNLCVTKAFVTKENLMTYMDLARDLGVSFVQFLEPRAVGHYKGKNVDLSCEQELIVEEIYLLMNYDDAFMDYPAVCYHGYHQRRMGCHAAGNRSLYVDTVGDIHACPFCQKSTGNALSDNVNECMENLQAKGCHKF